MRLEKYSIGVGDRFGRQAKAQLGAILEAKKHGVDITPVWNKSYREHSLIKTSPKDTRSAADSAVRATGYTGPYRVDADHVGLKNVEAFIESSDFFTLDVADYIGQYASIDDVRAFVKRHKKYIGMLAVPGLADWFSVTESQVEAIARKYLVAVNEAAHIYHHIESVKDADNFITEVSMDETAEPQTPVELFFILAAIADAEIPAQTIAPKFSGRFNKGVDYVGNPAAFAREFEQDVAVVNFAIREFGLPSTLKLSVHSGSDKFSIYGSIRDTLAKFNSGVHLKTAGTTWLEEMIGLAMAGGQGLEIAKKIYAAAYVAIDDVCGPYKTVIDIIVSQLPEPAEVNKWSSEDFACALRHEKTCPKYNPNFRQLIHVSFKLAAAMGSEYLDALDKYESIISKNVSHNIFERHIKAIFI